MSREKTIENRYSRTRKIKKVFIANRGEIVLRIIQACRPMGIKTAAPYTKDDRNRKIENAADQYIPMDGNSIESTHMNIKKIIKAAKKVDADAIHPGYGFLAEDPAFAKACEDAGILFIGPSSETLEKVSDKISARKLAAESGIDTIQGSELLSSSAQAEEFGRKNGYPIVLKSCKGGGGRGIRIVSQPKDLQAAFDAAVNESGRVTGCKEVFAERYIKGRHIEVQFLADKKGNLVHLFDRECSIQRRNQKLIEEAPAPIESRIKEELYRKTAYLAIRSGYSGAGTVEFLVTPKHKASFLEINPRIQVEHRVTEMITGVDIVTEQIRIAQGLPLTTRQSDITMKGHAIECRILAENVREGFTPSRGRVSYADTTTKPEKETGGQYRSRVETAIYTGMIANPKYDSLLAKAIVCAQDRRRAINGMKDLLEHIKIEGVPNTITFCRTIIESTPFQKGDISTGFIEQNKILETHIKRTLTPEIIATIATAIYEKECRHKLLDQAMDRWVERAIEESTNTLR